MNEQHYDVKCETCEAFLHKWVAGHAAEKLLEKEIAMSPTCLIVMDPTVG